MSSYERDPITGNLSLLNGMRNVDECKTLLLEICYPVGSIYTSTDNTSPATFLGGTWISLDGYVLRAADGTIDVVTPNQNLNDGGADSVTVSSVASHNHTQNSHNHTQDAHSHKFSSNTPNVGASTSVGTEHGQISGAAYGSGDYTMWSLGTNVENATATNQAKTATNQANGANYTVPTLPKYKNVYMWERTA